ncbi:MAG: nucleotidyltransferase domain-containing protein [Clostridia bacterium]|nr:nucleotidyltransferase domain-containing protein [Clostridia bacterium]
MSEHVYSLDEIRAMAAPIAERHGVNALYLFGSYARGEATPSSDMDFRIEKGQLLSLFQLAALKIDLEDVFQKELDVLTTQMLSPQFLNSIQPEEVLVYARG